MQPSLLFLFGFVYKKISVVNLNAVHITGGPLFGSRLAMFETEKCLLGFLFRSPFFVSCLLSISFLSMSFLESTIFVKRVLSLFSNANHFSVFLGFFCLFFSLISREVIFLIVLSMVTSNNRSEKSGKCDVLH